MSDQDSSQNPAMSPNAGAVPERARLRVLGQYVKDLSFENPNALQMLSAQQQQAPQMNVQVDVKINKLSETDFEVTLALQAGAKRGETVMFAAEVDYAGLFRLENMPAESLEPVLMIECPRLLFPFVRRILAETTQEGGYPPLLLDPIDFVAYYQSRVQQTQGLAAAPQGSA